MYRELAPKGVKIPNGFAVIAEAYREIVHSAGILPEMEELVGGFRGRTSMISPGKVTGSAN